MLVLPWEPVTPTTVSPSRSRATTWAASACSAAWASSTTTVGSGVGREPSTATAPASAGLAGVVVAVDVLAGEGDEEAARLGLPAVEHGRRGHRHGAVALDRPADDRGDLVEAERDHARDGARAGGIASYRSYLQSKESGYYRVGISKISHTCSGNTTLS